MASGASSISVTGMQLHFRVRPFTIQEAAQITKTDDGISFLGEGSLAGAPTPKLGGRGIHPVIKVIDDRCLIFDPPQDSPITRFQTKVVSNMGKRVKDQTFAFDRVFDDNTTQGDVYEATTRGLLDNVLDGYNATVFAYGATGCGKTHTITGTAQQPGIIFLTMQELFEKISERSEEKQTEITLSYLEIYNETIRDLLVPGGRLSSHKPQDVQEVMDMIVKGNEYRTISPTAANATSSRSHAVLQINVAQKDRNASVNEPHTMATLSIIDLAGSERASATKNRGERLIEGANINKSLLALGSCINALCDPRKKNHVPYRNSKLTRLLKFSLGGNCKTVMIVCVSPSSAHFDETQNTLRMNWERAIDSALQNSVRQLVDIDGCEDGSDIACLTRETELLKANAARDSYQHVLDQEKGVDAGVMQVLLSTQFEIMSSLNDIIGMTEEDAVQHGKKTISKLFETCSSAAASVIKPDGTMKITGKFAPTKRVGPQIPSPMKSSPRRRKIVVDQEQSIPSRIPVQKAPLGITSTTNNYQSLPNVFGSPLREIDGVAETGNNSGSESENLKVEKPGHAHTTSDVLPRTRRARSPTVAQLASSPTNENQMFTASHARRMVKSDKESTISSVLSPRTAPIIKHGHGRRTTVDSGRSVSGGHGHGVHGGSGSLRVTAINGGSVGSAPKPRESVMSAMGKGGWR
ncbi:hypothetical protein DID88_000208 [Monilinia fructigena]|uniref:Kinesin-like protein n=1 Tax=Monilinia fructigena TaxID=38457 RepID=A0A395IM41_9HELO|nr:hypothetical protein DID88_000208 [Monilinia fructigena]